MNMRPDPEGWQRLSELAHWELEHPDQSAPLLGTSNLALQVRLWSYPRWGPRISWGLFLPLWRDSQALVRESRWDEPADRRRLDSSVEKLRLRHRERPTLRIRDASVDADSLELLLLQATDVLSVWASPEPRAFSFESGSFGIEGFRSLTHARMEWTEADEDAPEGGVAWAMRLRELLRSSLRERETA